MGTAHSFGGAPFFCELPRGKRSERINDRSRREGGDSQIGERAKRFLLFWEETPQPLALSLEIVAKEVKKNLT